MFRKVKQEDIENILLENQAKYFDEIEELEDLALEDDTQYYASEDCVLIMSPQRVKTHYIVVPLKPDFDLAQLEAFIHKKSDQFQVHLNVTGIDAGSLRFQEPYDVSDAYSSFYMQEEANQLKEAEEPGVVRKLKTDDKRHVNNFPDEGDIPGMKLKETFNIFRDDDLGSILGYFSREGHLLGYISYMPSLLDAYSVDAIFVQPKYRRRGIGTVLAQSVAKAAQNEGLSCYWPVAQTELVEKTAEAAGFTKVSSRMMLESL